MSAEPLVGFSRPRSSVRLTATGRVVAELPPVDASESSSLRAAIHAVHFMSVIKLRHAARRRPRNAQPDVLKPPVPTLVSSLKHVLFFSRINMLLVILPFALLAQPLGLPPAWAFVANFVVIVPLAQLLGVATEEVALYSTEMIGGLLNATLGNATEVIISVFAIRAGLLRVVQVSLLGSILSNLLLVLGCSFIAGGIRFREQRYSAKMAAVNCSLLKMAVLGLMIPTALVSTMRANCAVPCHVVQIEQISHGTAVVLFVVYVGLLLFQLRTHAYLHEADNPNEPYPSLHVRRAGEEEEEDEEEAAMMTLSGAVVVLAALTVLIALCSELLVATLEVAAAAMRLTDLFIGLVLLPIIGNAAEHATAIVMAYKGKTDLALGVALGSSVQIALGVIPALVLVAWAIGSPLTLDFGAFEAIVLLVTALVATSTLGYSATWLDGLMLIAAYTVVGVAYYYAREIPYESIRNRACSCGEACCTSGLE
ncbi:hypothetical protein KFE25_008574 [Diacronema lutheri]|uniref:Sodium/calcium exchanger membrane region domain-containing protein n=3 Tax=Diacronema lutheri TaxID=2081491 RepID=A0A8J6CJP2_DIALT|nr:hypothetical protein KFE25_008574 [Diacronema lutheri]